MAVCAERRGWVTDSRSEPGALPQRHTEDLRRRPGGAIAFLHDVFDARGELVDGPPTELAIGDSIVMVSGTTERALKTAGLYVYVDDTDTTFERAISAGATALEQPAGQSYGDRRAMFQDPSGNIFQVAHRLHQD
jgi:PhnB protein